MIRAGLRSLVARARVAARVRSAAAGGILLALAATFAGPASGELVTSSTAGEPCVPPVCTITGPDSICAGETAELCGPEGDYTYLWSTGATTRCITISEQDTYTLTVTNVETGCTSTSAGGSVPTRTAWQMHDGLEVTPENPLGLLAFTCIPPQHGDPCEYEVATIPPQADPAWGPAPDPEVIDFHVYPSRVCQAPTTCNAYGDFTYFQTLVDIPVAVVVTQFTIAFSGMDDGARVSIFNSAHPAGLVVPGSYVYFGGTGTTNLAPYVVAGEVNRVVVTQVDDCCIENNLDSAIVVLNGHSVATACGKFVRVTSCGTPPGVSDAFPIFDNDRAGPGRVDSVLVVFDQPVEAASAEQLKNYSLESSGVIASARRLDSPRDHQVVLTFEDGPADGVGQQLNVRGVRGLVGNLAMLEPLTLSFISGVLDLADVAAPDPDALVGEGCDDRSRFLSHYKEPDVRVSFSGTVTGRFGEEYSLQDAANPRAGLWVRPSETGLTLGHTYVLSGILRDVEGQTQARNLVYVRDLGPGPSFVPALQSIRILTDDTCDENQRFLTGDDYEGMLVTVDRVEVVEDGPPGGNFYVVIPGTQVGSSSTNLPRTTAGPQDGILIVNAAENFDFAATAGEIVAVTGVLGRVGESFAIYPRSNADILDFGPVPTFSVPLDVSKSATQSRDPDIVRGTNGELFMAWWRIHYESVHSLSLDHTQNWSVAIPNAQQSAQPALAVTPSNKIGMLTAGVDELFFRQSTDGGFQMDPLVTAVDGYATRYPALTVGSGEHFHAAWERTDAGVFYSRSLSGGEDFSAPYAIASNGGGAQNSMARICASSQDHVFVFWQYDEPGPGIHRVLYRRSTDAGESFSPARRVRDESNPLTSTVKLTYLGDAQIGSDGTLYVMGLDEAGGVAFLRSTNDGLTFDLVSHLPEPAARGSLCPKSFAVGPGGEIHALVGECGTALYYTRSADGGATWGPAVNVTSVSSPTVGEPRGAKIVLDGTGVPVIVWFSSVGGSTEIFSSRLLD